MNKYWLRITQSARGERFNPLIWPFLWATLVYSFGFAFFSDSDLLSSLHSTMLEMHPVVPVVWGTIGVLVIALGASFLLFKIPLIGKFSGVTGFMMWLFAAVCYGMAGAWIVMLAVTGPNVYFWAWQYFSLRRFRREDRTDKRTIDKYDEA